MYNLIVTAEEDAWDASPYSMARDRLGEHTAESLKVRYRVLSDKAIEELTSFPTLFAHEQQNGQPARVGRVTGIARPSGRDIRFKFKLFQDVPPIPPERLKDLAWDLDVGEWEMNRTHWAVKDVDLLEVLRDAGMLTSELTPPELSGTSDRPQTEPRESISITPQVFAMPAGPRDDTLVALMMPFSPEFDPVH